MTRKRVSLKDKSPESLGLPQKKGKGVEALFGEAAADTIPSNSEMVASEESLPVNEADEGGLENSIPLEGDVDELGLPVAMEAAPLSLAATAPAAVDELGLPVAMEGPPADLSVAVPLSSPPPVAAIPKDELSGLANESDLAPVTPPEDDLSALMEEPDLAEVVPADDLSSLADQTPAPTPFPAADLPPAPSPVETFPSSVPAPVSIPPVEPAPVPATTLPESVASPAPTPLPEPAPPVQTAPLPRPMPAPPPAVTPATSHPVSPTTSPVPSPSVPTPVRIETVTGLVTENVGDLGETFIPEGIRIETPSYIYQLEEREKVEQDEAKTEKIVNYVGEKRRQKLIQEIEDRLYDEVKKELHTVPKDTEFAHRTLREAHDILLEDPRQYDEALYRVAVVETMITRRRNLRRWSYTWGTFVLVYALLWLTAFIAGFVFTGVLDAMADAVGTDAGIDAVRAAWFSALAGGIGGVTDVLWTLYYRVALKQDFDRQQIMYYIVKPIMGFVLGAVIHFVVTAGLLLFNSSQRLGTDQIVAVQVLLGWIAGFRQVFVFDMIHVLVKKISPQGGSMEPVSVAPEPYVTTVQVTREGDLPVRKG